MTAQDLLDMTKLEGCVLKSGAHADPAEGLCLMEAFAYVRGIPHTDHPACVSPAIGAYGRRINDAVCLWRDDKDRTRSLLPLIPRMVNTANDGKDEQRAYIATDYAVRVFAPIRLEARGKPEAAAKLRALAPIVDKKTAQDAATYADADAAADAAAAADAYADAAAAADAAAYAYADADAYADAYADAASDAAAYADAAADAAAAACAAADAYADADACAAADAYADAGREKVKAAALECFDKMLSL